MGFIEGRTRFGEVTRPTISFAILAAVLTLSAVSLLAFPAKALAAADLSTGEQSQVIDDTISDNPLPNTGGPSLLALATIALGLSVLGGAAVVRSGVRRRDR